MEMVLGSHKIVFTLQNIPNKSEGESVIMKETCIFFDKGDIFYLNTIQGIVAKESKLTRELFYPSNTTPIESNYWNGIIYVSFSKPVNEKKITNKEIHLGKLTLFCSELLFSREYVHIKRATIKGEK